MRWKINIFNKLHLPYICRKAQNYCYTAKQFSIIKLTTNCNIMCIFTYENVENSCTEILAGSVECMSAVGLTGAVPNNQKAGPNYKHTTNYTY